MKEFSKEAIEKIKSSMKNKWVILIALVVSALIVFVAYKAISKNEAPKTNTSINTTQKAEDNAKSSAKQVEPQNPGKEVTLPAGEYIVGDKILPGRYVCTPDSNGNFSIYEKDSPIISEILSTDSNLGSPSVTLTLEKGQKVVIQGVKNLKFSPSERKIASELSTGRWTVGKDIAAGKLRCKVTSGRGNVVVYRDNIPVINEIMSASGDLGNSVDVFNLQDGDELQISYINKMEFENAE